MTGRPPKPTPLHRLEGTRPSRKRDAEPRFERHTGTRPRWAKLTGPAAEFWARTAPLLVAQGVLTRGDEELLVLCARRYSEYHAAAAIVEEQGPVYVVETRDGRQQKASPAVAIRDRAWGDLLRGLAAFGLSPSARAKVAGTPAAADVDSAFEQWMAGRKATR